MDDELLNGQGFVPEGAGDPLPALPQEETVTADDARRASRLWDRMMPDLAGMLGARVIKEPAR